MEQLRPDVEEKRAAYLKLVAKIDPRRLVFMDESWLNAAMTRSHAWVIKGYEFVERTPTNWGPNLTLLGAMRLSGWVVLTTMFKTVTKKRFLLWVKQTLLPKLRRGDVLVLDNLAAHKHHQLADVCAARRVRVLFLPPYSPDLNPIEPGWAIQKQYVRRQAPRHAGALRLVARRGRYRVTPLHCRRWFGHAGYRVQPR